MLDGVDDHHHLSPLQPRVLFHRSIVFQIGFHALQELSAKFLVRHFAPPKTKRHLRLIPVFQKSNQVSQFNPIVADIRAGAEFNLLNLHLFLLSFRRVPPFAFFVLKFAEIHDSANRRCRIRRNFNEVQTRFLRFSQGIGCGDDADLLTVITDETDLRRINSPIYPQLFLCRDVSSPPKY
jgi:hypothetical protein